jgi:hypothetical protein
MNRRLVLSYIAFLVLTPGLAAAADDRFNDPFQMGLAMFRPNVDTVIRVDSSSGVIGTTLDFQTLGLDQTEWLPALAFEWQLSRRHAIWASYFELDRNGFSNTAVEIRFLDQVFLVGTQLNAQFNTKVLSAGYGFSFNHDKDKQFGFRIGLNIQDLKVALESDRGLIAENAEVVAPLPTLGFNGGIRLAEKWKLKGDIGYFALNVGDYDGRITQATLAIYYDAFRNVGLTLGYQYFSVLIKSEDVSWPGRVEYEYFGPAVAVYAKF